MRKIESLFITVGLFAAIVITGGAIWNATHTTGQGIKYEFPTTKYGAFFGGPACGVCERF